MNHRGHLGEESEFSPRSFRGSEIFRAARCQLGIDASASESSSAATGPTQFGNISFVNAGAGSSTTAGGNAGLPTWAVVLIIAMPCGLVILAAWWWWKRK